MRNRIGWLVAGISFVLTVAVASVAVAQGKKAAPTPAPVPAPAPGPAPAAAGGEVTLKGVLMNEHCCVPKGNPSDDPLVLFAVEGTSEVAAALDSVMKENWPGDSMDGDQAQKIQDAFIKQLKYYITPGDATAGLKCGNGNPGAAVTGVISEKDGKKWIKASKIDTKLTPQNRKYAETALKYPDKMMAPDKPLLPAGSKPLILKVNDALSLKCILLPAGKFMMHDSFYVIPRYNDSYPYLVTLTKPFYVSEIPVTQEMYESLMGSNPSEQKGPQIPVTQLKCIDMHKFCEALSAKNGGRKVRLLTYAEWEYAARVGTSNPAFLSKYGDQLSVGGAGKGALPPVKSKKPNAWGLYDMPSCAWEMTSDKWMMDLRSNETDPNHSLEDESNPGPSTKHKHFGKGNIAMGHWTVANHEGVGDGSGTAYGNTKFRVGVDATPEEIAALAKESKK